MRKHLITVIGIVLAVVAIAFGVWYFVPYIKSKVVFTDPETGEKWYFLSEEAKQFALEDIEFRKVSDAKHIKQDSYENTLDTLLSEDTGRKRIVDSDVVGKITIECCNIDYMVYQDFDPDITADEDFYLHHNYLGEYDINGSIFTRNYDSNIIIIYGHNMTNGSMFAHLNDVRVGAEIELTDYGWEDDTTHLYKVVDYKTVNNVERESYISTVTSGLILQTCSGSNKFIVIAEEIDNPVD